MQRSADYRQMYTPYILYTYDLNNCGLEKVFSGDLTIVRGAIEQSIQVRRIVVMWQHNIVPPSLLQAQEVLQTLHGVSGVPEQCLHTQYK